MRSRAVAAVLAVALATATAAHAWPREAGRVVGPGTGSAPATTAQAPDEEAIRGALARAYRGIDAEPSLLERIRNAVLRFVLGIVERLARAGEVQGALAWALVIALLVAVVWLLRRIGIVPARALRRAGPRAEAREEDWNRLADEAASRGDLTGAVRYRFRALVVALIARDVVRASPSVTAGECRVAVSARMPLAYPAVARATTVFERALYGNAALARADVEEMREAEQAVTVA